MYRVGLQIGKYTPGVCRCLRWLTCLVTLPYGYKLTIPIEEILVHSGYDISFYFPVNIGHVSRFSLCFSFTNIFCQLSSIYELSLLVYFELFCTCVIFVHCSLSFLDFLSLSTTHNSNVYKPPVHGLHFFTYHQQE